MTPLGQVAVVILNFDGARHLRTYLPSVVRFSRGAQIVVADNGSTDESAQVVTEFPEVQWLALRQNFGFAEGYNQALALVDAEVYVLLNSDVRVTEGWLVAPLARLAADPRVAAVQPKVLADARPTYFEYAGASGGYLDALGYPYCRGRIFDVVEEDWGQYDDAVEVDWATGACLFVRAEVWHLLEGFDGDFFAHMEEIDFCWRLRRAGFRCWVTPASVVYHLGGGTLAYEHPRKTYLNFRNSLAAIYKNQSPARGIATLAARQALDALAALRFLVGGRGGGAHLASIWRAHVDFYRGKSRWRAQRRRWQVLAKAANDYHGKHGSKASALAEAGSTGPSEVILVDFYLRGRRTFSELRSSREIFRAGDL